METPASWALKKVAESLMELVEKTHFPWLMSNVIDNETGRPLADGKITHIMEWWGRRIGLVRYLSRLGKAESNKTTPLNKFSIQKHTPRTRYKYYKGKPFIVS